MARQYYEIMYEGVAGMPRSEAGVRDIVRGTDRQRLVSGVSVLPEILQPGDRVVVDRRTTLTVVSCRRVRRDEDAEVADVVAGDEELQVIFRERREEERRAVRKLVNNRIESERYKEEADRITMTRTMDEQRRMEEGA